MCWSAGPVERGVNRRHFLATSGSLAAAAVWSMRAEGAIRRNLSLGDNPFQLGVTSGDPSADGFVIWTRLAPKPLEGGGMPAEAVEVDWQVAEDEQMTKVVRQGTVTATLDWAHSVHVEVDGLRPDRWYWDLFRAAGESSRKGRARTFPAIDAMPERLRFAFASCQHFEYGYFTAFEHMAHEDLDFIAHLGDYIYEYAGADKRVRKHLGKEIDSLDDYRNRYAQYKLDPHLQEVHRLFPWIVTWDDHEVDNNYAGAISEEKNVDAPTLLARRARAYQVYYEQMPLRRAALPKGPDMLLYRQLPFGQLASFFVLDTRQYRTDQPCGDGDKAPCPDVLDPKATLLGDEQEQWLLDGLTRSSGRWNVLAQQVMMARADRKPGEEVKISMDQWPGYEVNRRRVLRAFDERKIANPIVLTGDIHTHWANNLILDFEDLDSRIVGTEFVGSSITSGGDSKGPPKHLAELYAENPFVKYYSEQRGYVSCNITPEQWRTDFRSIDYVTRPGAPLETAASFVVENGRPGLQRA